MAIALVDLPNEILVKIFFFLSARLRKDHERGIRQAYRDRYHVGMAAGYVRLGFEYPLPMSLLLTNRCLRNLALDYVFTQSALRVDVAEDNEGAGTYDHYDEQDGPDASYVSEKWTMLAGRLTPGHSSTSSSPLAQAAHITQHPYVERLRSLHVNHWITIHGGHCRISGDPMAFVPLIKSLTGLRQLVLFLDITTGGRWGWSDLIPNRTIYSNIEFTPVVRVISDLPGGSPIQVKYIVTQTNSDLYADNYDSDTEDPAAKRSHSSVDRLKTYLSRESANGIDVGLFHKTTPCLSGGNYGLDAKKFRSHASLHNPGDLGKVLGCSVRPGQARVFTGVAAFAGAPTNEIMASLAALETADLEAAADEYLSPPSIRLPELMVSDDSDQEMTSDDDSWY